jgi:hypothetical protein
MLRLRKHLSASEPRIQTVAPIARGKDERNTALPKLVRDREGLLFSEGNVEDGPVERGARDQFERAADRGRWSYYGAAKLLDPLLHKHGNQGLVLDNKDARRFDRMTHLPVLEVAPAYRDVSTLAGTGLSQQMTHDAARSFAPPRGNMGMALRKKRHLLNG